MCNLINIHTYIHLTRMTGPDCVVRCNLINTYIHTKFRHQHGEEDTPMLGQADAR